MLVYLARSHVAGIHGIARLSAPQDSAAFAAQSIATLSRAVRAIQARPPQATPESLQALYALCEGTVGRGSGEGAGQILYDRIKMEIERQVGDIKREMLKVALDEMTEESWLQSLDAEWKGFLNQMLLIRSIFLHLDRTFVLQTTGLLSIL